MENKESFHYTYRAKEQEEIKSIRKKYAAPEQTEDKMAQLRRLDGSVTKKASSVSLIFGIVGTLILGSGMSLAMTDIGRILGLGEGMALLCGIGIGTAGSPWFARPIPSTTASSKESEKELRPRSSD